MVDIAVIPGDGIGKEIIPQVCKLLLKINPSINFYYYDISSDRYLQKGITITDNEIDELKSYTSIFFGALGDFRVKPGIMEQGVILKLRKDLDLYMNIRPAISYEKITGNKIDITIYRENKEDFYTDIGGEFNSHKIFAKNDSIYNYKLDISGKADDEIYYSTGFLSRKNITRFFKKTYSMVGSGNATVTDKANAINMYSLWRDIAKREAEASGTGIKFEYADSLAYNMIRNPDNYKSIIAPNLYGDILSDMASALAGGLGYAPSGNIGDKISMFEPVHGSAPGIAGMNIANPVASILSAAMMLRHIKMEHNAEELEKAVANVINNNGIPVESGGKLGTTEFINNVDENSIYRKI
ncbi:MAG: isocitrate/isopropylmalate family dehydrogenase [Ferroplasma sp.]